jgi:hypothetical protein
MTGAAMTTAVLARDARGTDARAGWAAEFGRHWRAELSILLLLFGVSGALSPLADPDLPAHLALGRWIVEHRAVPFREPLAWTRSGAPYYAYSWALEVLYYLLRRATGLIGLHVLQGLLVAGAAAAMLVLARAAGWRLWTGIVLALCNVTIASFLAAQLRPQLVLFIAAPLAWALAYRILQADRIGWYVASLVAVNALAADTDLLYPLMGVPWVLLVTQPPREWRRGVALVVGTVAGWLLTPYALVWPAVFRLNFAPNALFTQPTPIMELKPGVQSVAGAPSAGIMFAALALLPWGVAGLPMRARERVAAALMWLAGLTAFAYAVRAMLIWWVLSLPTFARFIERLAQVPKRPLVLRMQKLALFLMGALFVSGQVATLYRTRSYRTDVAPRPLALETTPPAERLVTWLECRTLPGARGRIFTGFLLGSYLAWRLPTYSASIDGRNIFPDSVARAEAYHLATAGPVVYGPWASADLAMIGFEYPVTAILDTATGWRRAAVTDSTALTPWPRTGLWVKEDWWNHSGRVPLPPQPVVVSRASEGGDPCRRAPEVTARIGAGGAAHGNVNGAARDAPGQTRRIDLGGGSHAPG